MGTPFLFKLLVTNLIVFGCVRLGKQSPSLAGLIATMPLTSLLVLIWLRLDNPDNNTLLAAYTRGVLWGIIPTILFFAAAYLAFRREFPFPAALAFGSGVWLTGALVHHWLVK